MAEQTEKEIIEEQKRYKARQLRYKKPIAQAMSLEFLQSELWDMQEVVSSVVYAMEDDDALLDALGGSEEEMFEFRMAFADLEAELDNFQNDLDGEWIPECFDELFVAAKLGGQYLGYDGYERDYYGLHGYENTIAEKEAEKHVCRLTKKELLEAVQQSLRVYSSYMALRYRYDCLEASLRVLQGTNMELVKLMKSIEDKYEEAEQDTQGFTLKYHKSLVELDELTGHLPQEVWIG